MPKKPMTPTQRKKARSATVNRARVKKVYGLTGEDQEAVLSHQDGLCAICRGKRPYRLCWDHNHATGEVRGALCKSCNRWLLPAAKDDPEILRAAIAYLENPPVGTVLGARYVPIEVEA